MASLKRWISWPYLQATLIIFFGTIDLLLLGMLAELGKSDWASWVQAIGSIGAIGGAFAIARSQHDKERQLDKAREAAERRKTLDTELLARTLAIKNMVQVCTFATDAARDMTAVYTGGQPIWKGDQYSAQIDRARSILDAMIAPQTDHLAVIAALSISALVGGIQSNLKNAGGSMAHTLLDESVVKVLEAYRFLDNLLKLQAKLLDICTARGLPLESIDFR